MTSRLAEHITPKEGQCVIDKLNSARASGYDDIPAELFNCTTDLLAHTIANIFNSALEVHEQRELGKGVLILLHKPGKPTGPLTILRPIVLLSVLRKTLSLIVLTRITLKIDVYLSPSQSGFRLRCSMADVIFGYRWLCAKAQRVTLEFLGINLSCAFDTKPQDGDCLGMCYVCCVMHLPSSQATTILQTLASPLSDADHVRCYWLHLSANLPRIGRMLQCSANIKTLNSG